MKTYSSHENIETLHPQPCRKTAIAHAVKMDEPFKVDTLEGVMMGDAGDYLMQGVAGELYPCAKEIFESSYVWIGLCGHAAAVGHDVCPKCGVER